MGITKQMNIKNRTYYFYNHLINTKDFDPKLLKLDKKTSLDIDIYYIGYVTKKGEYKINSVNPLYLLVHRIGGFSEVLKKYSEVWNGIKECIEKIKDSKSGEYDKDYMKTKFNSADDFT